MDYTELLLGNKYVLLREEFLEWRDWNREVKPVINHLLVTLGGSDKNNYSLKIIRALERLSSLELEINVLVGVSNPHINVLKEFIMGSDLDITILENVRDMPGIMAWADLAFTGGGTTVWEMAFMGLPTIVGATSPVEELLIKGLNKCNLFLNVGRISEVTVSELTLVLSDVMGNRELRCFMSNQGKNLVDGYGVDRVINCMKKK
jgi:spore coat polysaccharide biosynthesis predicted glycosyltransferase SpsG